MLDLSRVLTRVRRGLHAALADLPTSIQGDTNSVAPAVPQQAAEPSHAKVAWTEGLPSEIAFWDNWFKTQGGVWSEDYKTRLNPDTPLQQTVEDYLPDPAGDAIQEILDVGSGPLTMLGKRSDRRKFRITAVDPLADAYDRIMAKHGVVPPVRTSWCHGELLTTRFAPDTFDLVWAQNSLDHSYEPVRIIEQALVVTKPGGYVALSHARNEALNGNWDGLHQWNFDHEGGDFIIWNRQGRVNVSKLLQSRAEIRTQGDDTFVHVSFRKPVRGSLRTERRFSGDGPHGGSRAHPGDRK
ncbi:bifunctional 2-polyprenyl-6-hydroxyphenol methylase/3-demethylubiquinol 3-O-methyltransferase UbiG [Myxococcus sp. RHSTA-1-4]|uniref:class I SAM-dependent methyltransferase n=1 Tax=Myxococcus sp. RHSTA-1-4 TaxID=2874601 RepID=UPI001CBE6465|nr:methyltransferase domain-containing protein [Myxococcus sp. RHSTA-1-4]MBZ4421265.1 class I SAM-dependent methyltransferase [Myxococcus sp. RHSTA-1-4]